MKCTDVVPGEVDERGRLQSGGDGVSLLEASKSLAFLSSLSFAEEVHGPSLAFCGELDEGAWKLNLEPLVCKRGGRSDRQRQESRAR